MTSSLTAYSSLVSAVEEDDVKTVRSLLLSGVDVNANLDDDLGTALHVAAVHGSVACADVILSRGDVIVDALATEHVKTPLMTAAAHGHVTMLQRLLAAGADIDRQTPGCSTPLIVACHYGHVDCAHALLDAGADPYVTNPWGYTALYMATDTIQLLDRLLAYDSVDVNQRCGERAETALHLAAVIGSVAAIEALLNAGADINARTTFNENALWLAVWKGQTEAARTLIKHNIEVDVSSNGYQVYVKHYLPLEVALGLQNYSVVRALLHVGCALSNNDSGSDRTELLAEPGPLTQAPWVRLHAEVFDYLRADADMLAWFARLVRNPDSLRELCRRTIRRRVGVPLGEKLNKLRAALPRSILNFIAMSDI